MSVGGLILAKLEMVTDDNPTQTLIRYHVVDDKDETYVYAQPAELEPQPGQHIWWQSGKIYFNNDQHTLIKIGDSHGVNDE